jgi:hypothetical protein
MDPVSYIRVEAKASGRLAEAQERLEASIRGFGLQAVPFPAGKDLVFFGEVLRAVRAEVGGAAFVWCNSDVVLTRNPFDVPDPGRVYGFHRREVPSGEINRGVDMFYIPTAVWDGVLARDIPRLYAGASFVDWWIPRRMAALGIYGNLEGYIDHVTHPTSAASGSDANRHYQWNFREYNRFAARNALPPIPAAPFLVPRVGHVWGLRDLWRRLISK